MKKFALFIALFLFLASCAQYETTRIVKPDSASTHASLTAETSEIWTRPLEVGFQVKGTPIEGVAESVVGDELAGNDGPKVNNFNLFASSKNPKLVAEFSPMLKKAALNAMKENDADGLYITMSEEIIEVVEEKKDEEVKKIKRTARVRGVPLKMVVYDKISYERSRTHKFCDTFCAEKDNCPMACVFPQNELEALKIEFLQKNKEKSQTEIITNTSTNKETSKEKSDSKVQKQEKSTLNKNKDKKESANSTKENRAIVVKTKKTMTEGERINRKGNIYLGSGISLLIAGVVVGLAGSLGSALSISSDDDYYDYYDDDDGAEDGALAGMIICPILGAAMIGGSIPLMIKGTKLKKQAKQTLGFNSFTITPNRDGLYAQVGFSF